VDLNDAASAMGGQTPAPMPPARLPVEDERYHVSVQKRALSVYVEVASADSLAQPSTALRKYYLIK